MTRVRHVVADKGESKSKNRIVNSVDPDETSCYKFSSGSTLCAKVAALVYRTERARKVMKLIWITQRNHGLQCKMNKHFATRTSTPLHLIKSLLHGLSWECTYKVFCMGSHGSAHKISSAWAFMGVHL